MLVSQPKVGLPQLQLQPALQLSKSKAKVCLTRQQHKPKVGILLSKPEVDLPQPQLQPVLQQTEDVAESSVAEASFVWGLWRILMKSFYSEPSLPLPKHKP